MSEIYNRAYGLKLIFETGRKLIDWNRLLTSKSDNDLAEVLTDLHYSDRQLILHKPGLLLSILRDRQFPKRSRDAQEQFIADSFAALGRVSIRRSRDIVQSERSAKKKRRKIMRREFYIECSCNYRGPAFRDACPKCGARVSYVDFATNFTVGADPSES